MKLIAYPHRWSRLVIACFFGWVFALQTSRRTYFPALLIGLLLRTGTAYGQPSGQPEQVVVAGKKMAYQTDGLATRPPGTPVVVFEGGVGAGTENFTPLFAGLTATKVP